LRQAVWSCYQEDPTAFKDYLLRDPGAYQEPPLSGKITWRISDPQREPKTEEQRGKIEKAQALMERIKRSVEARKHGMSETSSGEGDEQA
jgi:hypothetical protein